MFEVPGSVLRRHGDRRDGRRFLLGGRRPRRRRQRQLHRDRQLRHRRAEELAVVQQVPGSVLRRQPGSKCAAGGAHTKSGSGNYIVAHNSPSTPGEQNWRWCSKCQGLFFGGNAGSKCAAGGAHTKSGSGNYTLVQMGPGDPQPDWRRCSKCQGSSSAATPARSAPPGPPTARAAARTTCWSTTTCRTMRPVSPTGGGAASAKVCSSVGTPAPSVPAGAPTPRRQRQLHARRHRITKAPGEDNWRWCSKCQGLLFGGKPGSKCPAGGAHSKTGSGNYHLLG